MRKIIYITRDSMHAFPPCISQIVMLCNLGIEVYVIMEVCDIATLDILKKAGARVKLLGDLRPQEGTIAHLLHLHWFRFSRKIRKEFIKEYCDDDIIWIGTMATAFNLKKYLKNKRYILNVLELYDEFKGMQKRIKILTRNAKAVIACETNRARLMRRWHDLDKIPYVMPNKPHYEMEREETEQIHKLKNLLRGKKYILYQGYIDPERPMDTVAQALKGTKEKYTLVIIGNGRSEEIEKKMLKQLKEIYPDVIYGGYFPAPQHLYITEKAYIGVAFYDYSSLNTLFCAPNKTFEYSKFNVPILGNDIPGLQCTVEKNGAGICVDMENPDEIAKAIDKISENYEEYQKGAERLYNSVDNLSTTKKILEDIGFIE